jgi:hypothetical protein
MSSIDSIDEFEGFLYRDLLFEYNESALRYFSKRISEENGRYEFIDTLALEQAELIRQAENLGDYIRGQQPKNLKGLASKPRKLMRGLGHEIRHYKNTINLHDS